MAVWTAFANDGREASLSKRVSGRTRCDSYSVCDILVSACSDEGGGGFVLESRPQLRAFALSLEVACGDEALDVLRVLRIAA